MLYDLYLAQPQKALDEFERYIEIAGENKQVAGWVVELRKRVGAPPPGAEEGARMNTAIKNSEFGGAMLRLGRRWPRRSSQPSPPRGDARSGQAGGRATAQSEAGEPRADTSESGGAAGVQRCPGRGRGRQPRQPPRRRPRRRGSGRGAAASGGARSGPKIDRLDLGTATVTGDREQPKVMYIVPWKKSDIGDLAGKPMNSLVDEILAPVDRDVFKREVVYYKAVQADASQNGAPPKPAQQGEK